jgi:hypothetical protein
MTAGEPMRDGEIEAFVVDRYLETLLARAPRVPAEVVASLPATSAGIPTDLRATAERLVHDLPRYHPSFRFEEELAARLAVAAAALADGPPESTLIAFPSAPAAVRWGEDRGATVRPVVLGGVLTSAALSIAGAAWVAWRRSRAPGDPMTRAARAIARARAV